MSAVVAPGRCTTTGRVFLRRVVIASHPNSTEHPKQHTSTAQESTSDRKNKHTTTRGVRKLDRTTQGTARPSSRNKRPTKTNHDTSLRSTTQQIHETKKCRVGTSLTCRQARGDKNTDTLKRFSPKDPYSPPPPLLLNRWLAGTTSALHLRSVSRANGNLQFQKPPTRMCVFSFDQLSTKGEGHHSSA